MNLKKCADLYGSLADQVRTSRDEFERYEAATKEMLPDVDYKAVQLTNVSEKRYPMTEMYQKYMLLPEINFVSPPFTQLLTNLKLRREEEERYTKKYQIDFLF